MANKKTTIEVEVETRDKLEDIKLHPRQSFNEVIKLLLSKWNPKKQST